MPTNHYEMPKWGTPTDYLHGYLLEAKQEGAAWLSAQRPAQTWPGAVALMQDADSTTESTEMSNTVYPKSKRIARELIASLANFRHEGEVEVLWDNRLYDQAHILTDLDRHWYDATFANEAHRSGLQSGVIKGTGYWVQEWNPYFWGPMKGDTELKYVDPGDVTFVQLPADRDIQKAYMVIIRYELPINLAKRIYARVNPGFAHNLVPDQEQPNLLQKGLQKVQQFLSPALRVAGRTRQTANGSFPTVDIYHAYTLDGSVNEGLEPITMGALGTNWSYVVPYVGQGISTGIRNPETKEFFTVPAKPADCLMFPLRRLTVFSNTGIAYDGSSPWWHGDAPVARVWFNDLPWEALGGSLITDGRTIGEGINALLRGMEDSAAARINPPILYDDTLVSDSWAKALDFRKAGVRAKAPLSQGKPIELPIAPQYYDIPTWIPAFIAEQEGRMDYLAAVKDMVAIAKAKQIPGADTLEKLMEMAGPIVQDMVRAVEKPLTQLGTWRISDRFQFYTINRVIRTVGPDDFDPAQWKFQPDRLQQYLHNTGQGQEMIGRYGEKEAANILTRGAFQFTPEMLIPGLASMSPQEHWDAAKRMISEFTYTVTESGVNEIHRMTTKLFYLQLMKEGFPISWWTFAKVAKIANFGPPPEGTNTELERWTAQQHIKIELQGELQREAILTQMETQQMAGVPPGGAPGGGGGAGEPQDIPNLDNGGGARGRPQSYRNPPRMVQKDHGTRTTVTTA